MNRYRKGANVEREAVNRHIKNGAIFAGRMAGSKCKGKLKVDVIAIYQPNTKKGELIGTIYLEQYKKGKAKLKKEEKRFYKVKFPRFLIVQRKFIIVQ